MPRGPQVLDRGGDEEDGDPTFSRRLSSSSSCQGWPEDRLRTKAYEIVSSTPYKVMVSIVVVLNMIALIVDTDARAAGESEAFSQLVNVAFLAFYIVELLLQLFVDRSRFLCHPINILDTFIVMSGVFDLVLTSHALPNLQMLRIVRSLRLLRAARLVEIFPQLHAMVQGMWNTIVAMSWGVLFVFITLVVFSIFSVEFISPLDNVFDDKFCDHAFSSVFDCVIFFFRAIVVGDNWGLCIMPLVMHNWMWALFFVGASMAIQIGVMNLVLAVIVEEANSANDKDKRKKARELMAEKKQAARRLKHIFHAIDKNGDNKVHLEEFMWALNNNEDMQTIMTVLDVDMYNAKELFKAMDENGDGTVNATEFNSFLWRTFFTDAKTQIMATRINVDHVLQDQRCLLKGLETGNCAPPSPAPAARLEEHESVAERLRALEEALAEGHQQLLAAVDRRLAQVLQQGVSAIDEVSTAGAARPPPSGSAGAPGDDEQRPQRRTGDGTTRAVPPAMEVALGPLSGSSRWSPGRHRAGFHASLAEPARADIAAVGADAGALAEDEADAQRRVAPEVQERASGSAASQRDECAGGAGSSHWAGQTWQQSLHVDPHAPLPTGAGGAVHSTGGACFSGGPRWLGSLSDDPPALRAPPAAAAAALPSARLQAPQLPLRVPSVSFAPSGRRAPSPALAAARVGALPDLCSGGWAWGGQPTPAPGFLDWGAPLSVCSPSGCERMHAVLSFVLSAGMSDVPFDKLVLYLDSVGIELSVDEQDMLKFALWQHGC